MTEVPAQINTLIPMVNLKGERAVVNAWDVERRKADGWTLDEDADQWAGSIKSPNHDKPKGSVKAPAIDAVAAERSRVTAILKAAEDSQSELADKLIAEGKPEAEALKALADDKAAKLKAKGKPPAPPAPPAS